MLQFIPLPSQEELQKQFHYSVITGRLYPKVKRTGRPSKEIHAGSQRPDRYWTIGINGNTYHQHRVIWVLVTGEDPGEDRIDHYDHDPDNNAWHNLRRLTHRQNTTFSKPHSDSKTGLKGVRCLPKGRFQARIYHQGTTINLGCFPTAEQAAAAYREKEVELRGEFVNPEY